MKKIILYTSVLCGIIFLHSCYNNKKDILASTASGLETVSFRDDIVPIIASGGCGCHNNNVSSNAVQFSHLDTIFYSVIQARSGVYNTMANGGAHPGEGGIFFTPAQATLIKLWIAQGAKDNYVPPAITGPVTYTINIVPIYKTVCKGSTCHGGLGPTLDYAKMTTDKDAISKMMSSSGASGHPGGALSIDGTTTSTFLAWINQGLPQ